jgi:Helicase conserved C-terminal domain
MDTLTLPDVLPGDLDLATINRQLKQKSVRLDWSRVQSVSDEVLSILLDGIELEDTITDDSGVAENILDRLNRYFSQRPKPAKPKRKPAPEARQTSFLETRHVPAKNPEKTGELLETEFVVNPSATILPEATHDRIREELIEMIYKDLLGPAGGEEEEIDEPSVSDRYLVGLLAPRIRWKSSGTKDTDIPADPEAIDGDNPDEDSPELQDDLGITDKGNPEEGASETLVPPPNTLFPSSMGMTFCVSESATEIAITAEWGQYERVDSEYSFKDEGKPKKVWKRYPRKGYKIEPLRDGKEIDWVVCPDTAPLVYVSGKIRRLDGNGWIVTLFLVNAGREPAKLRDRAWLFQPQLTVTSPDPKNPAIFLKKPLPRSVQNLDPAIQAENEAMAMLYRHHVEFAVGHGVSVRATTLEDDPRLAVAIATSFIPAYEVPTTKPPTVAEIPDLQGLVLDMKVLADCSPEELPRLLTPLTTAYTNWIHCQEKRIDDPGEGLDEYRTVARPTIADCRAAAEKIRAGIETLRTEPIAREAFQFMNRAMALQRVRSLYSESRRRGEDASPDSFDIPKNRSWYPFQLAFILLNLPSLTDLHHPDRIHPTEARADLLWFPTGGGKTEAYLGLTAYTIAIRRLQGAIGGRDGEHGVAVLMRYTLRLLTLQQFQRATALICACESIRRQDEGKWGTNPFRIGLWVGQKSTPNSTDESGEAVKQVRAGRNGNSSPHQLTNCPWCGTRIDPGRHITVETFEKGRGQTLIKCGDDLGQCIFSRGEGLPVLVVDEEIYRRLPCLLIATVDKFAQLPWKGEIQMLFGRVNGYCERHGFRSPDIEDSDRHRAANGLPAAKTLPRSALRPPDLIIQDELHLISGPLGTLVGLYETAIDHLASWTVDDRLVRPKIIASTATIRQADSQVHNLFLRKLAIFPPRGLDIADNFFSRQRSPIETPGRYYLGICAPGRRLKATMIRVYLAVLAASQSLYLRYGQKADPWMTLVGYFNSLRELGGTRRLVDDDIRTRSRRMARRGLADRELRNIDELTSRKTSTEIPLLLDRLEIPFDPAREAAIKAKRKAGEKVAAGDPLDIILATNMISVGVDVKRLGVMVACGQPKNTAEYIQATSRVGRTYPGLVITVYNWARPRDLSHYERFAHYHATFYQQVEALSVTPFAPGALYRGLSALLVGLTRQMGEDFNANERAGAIDRAHPFVQAAIEEIVRRAELVEGSPTGARVRAELEAKLDHWLTLAGRRSGGTTLKYRVLKKDGTTLELLQSAGQGNWEEFTCLNSLRNVEPSIGLILSDRPPDDDSDRSPQRYDSLSLYR